MAVIQIDDRDALLEITNCCRTGCTVDYCYKKAKVSPQGQHVPLKILKDRLEWIKIYTNASTVTILGGEALLHPDFIAICDLILGMGFSLGIITSGVIGTREQKSLDYVFELFEKGLIDINLSYHLGRNEKQFESFMTKLHQRVEKRHKNIKLTGKDPHKQLDLFVRWTVSRQANLDKVDFHKIATWLYDQVRIAHIPIDDEVLSIAFKNYQKQFRDGSAQLNFNYFHNNDEYTGLRVKTTICGQQEITYGQNGPVINSSEVGVCPGVTSKVENTFVTLDSLLVRVDGGVSFAEAQCIDTLHPLLFVDQSQTREEVYQIISSSLKQIQFHVFLHNRAKAIENCDENGIEKECTACPFSRMCTPCWQTTRPWEK